MNKENQKGLIAIIGANTIFGLNTPVTKALVADWLTPMGYTTIRMIFGAFIFWIIGAFLKKEKVERKDLLVIMAGGLMGFLGTQFLFSQSLEFTTPVVFSLIMATTPVVVLVLSAIILKEEVSMRKIFGIVMSFSGAALIIVQSGMVGIEEENNQLGIFFSFLCVLCFAGYLMLTRKVSMKYQPVTVAKWMFLVSALAVFPFSFSVLEGQKMLVEEPQFEPYALMTFALIFSTTLAFFLMPYGLKRLEASTVSIFMNLQPIVASVAAILVGQNYLTWDKPIAAFLVITGVYFVTTNKLGKSKELSKT